MAYLDHNGRNISNRRLGQKSSGSEGRRNDTGSLHLVLRMSCKSWVVVSKEVGIEKRLRRLMTRLVAPSSQRNLEVAAVAVK